MMRATPFRVLVPAAATALVLCLLALIASGPAEAAFPGSNGKIIFHSDRDVGAGEIYAISPSGGTPDRLTFTNGSKDPAWSPDGSRIAFVSADNQVFVMKASGMDPDGSGRTQITTTPTAKKQPAWSPDGTQLAYVASSFDVDGQTDLELWVINADGSGRRQITDNTFQIDEQPAWSPDGSKIAFVSHRPGDTNRNVYVMNSDGSGTAVNLTPNDTDSDPVYQGHDDGPSWSPDGSKIVYTNGTSDPDVYTMSAADGSGKSNLTDANPNTDDEPAWSPDSTKIAYASVPNATNASDIYVMGEGGGGKTPLVSATSNDISPDWQPIPQCAMTDGEPNPDLTGTSSNDQITGTAGDDVICGLGGGDIINGLGGNDIVRGDAGADKLTGGPGNDTLNGGPGADTVLYPGSARVVANLVTEFAKGVGLDVLLGIENLSGSSAGDTLTGSTPTANVLKGLGGNDTLKTRDSVNNDTVNGGTGTDTCVKDAGDAASSCP